jgi:hypothetical protein
MGTKDYYHYAHIAQLAKLYDITGEPVLNEYSSKFAGHSKQGL